MSKKWVERIHCPDKNNKFYQAKPYGYNPFKRYNMFKTAGNCTSYAWGRFCEAGSYAAKGIVINNCKLPTCDAYQWFDSCIAYTKSRSVPQLGAVACWKKQGTAYGHVAIVEGFDAANLYVSESNYKKTLFRRHTYPIRNGKPVIVGYDFQGYIYNPWKDNNLR